MLRYFSTGYFYVHSLAINESIKGHNSRITVRRNKESNGKENKYDSAIFISNLYMKF